MSDNPPRPLAKEIETFERLFSSPGEHEGKFAVIHDEQLLGTFDTYDDALTMGYKTFGLKNFLVKRISSIPDVANYTRRLNFA